MLNKWWRKVSDAFIQNAHYPIHSHMNYRSIMDSLSCVEGIRLTTAVLRALTHWAIHTNYLCLGWSLNSIFNLHFSISHQRFQLKSYWCPKSFSARASTVSKVGKEKQANWTSRHRGVHWETDRGGGARTPLSAAMGGQYVNERLPRRWIMNEQHSEHSWREHVSLSLLHSISSAFSSSCPKISVTLSFLSVSVSSLATGLISSSALFSVIWSLHFTANPTHTHTHTPLSSSSCPQTRGESEVDTHAVCLKTRQNILSLHIDIYTASHTHSSKR